MSENCTTSKDGFTVALYTGDQQPRMINEVRSGLDCNCLCMGCGGKLVAVHPKKISAYFKHYSPAGTSFTGCPESKRNSESITHFLTKHHIAKVKQLHVPPLLIKKERNEMAGFSYEPYLVRPAQLLKFDEVILEKKQGSIIPDCIGIIGHRRLFIEVKVTHGIDDQKLKKIKDMKATSIELYVQEIIRSPDSPYLDKLVNNPKYLEWINAPILENLNNVSMAYDYFETQLDDYIAKIQAEEIAREQAKKLAHNKARPAKSKAILERLIFDWDFENLDVNNFLTADKEQNLKAESKSKLKNIAAPLCERINNKFDSLRVQLNSAEKQCQKLWEQIDNLRSLLPPKYQGDILNRDPRAWVVNIIPKQLEDLEDQYYQIWLSGMKEEEKLVIKNNCADMSETEIDKHAGISKWRLDFLSKEAFVRSAGGLYESEKEQVTSSITQELSEVMPRLITAFDEYDEALKASINKRAKLEDQISKLSLEFTSSLQEFFIETLSEMSVYGNSVNTGNWLASLQDHFYQQEKEREIAEWRSSRQSVRQSAWAEFVEQVQSKSDEEIFNLHLADKSIM